MLLCDLRPVGSEARIQAGAIRLNKESIVPNKVRDETCT